jgi:hypothetical protein
MEFSPRLLDLMEKATLALGRLDGLARLLPDLQLFLYFYVRKEAVLSSQNALRTGTGSSLFYAFFLPFGGLFAMVLRFDPQQRRNGKFRAATLACMLFAGVVFQAACGAKTPTPGTPAGSYIITVTGTDSSRTLAIPTTMAPLYVQ